MELESLCPSGSTLVRLVFDLKDCFTENSNNRCRADSCGLSQVLVAVEEITRLSGLDVAQKAIEALMCVTTTLMNPPRRIVRYEHIDSGKVPEHPRDLFLVVEMVSPRLVAPTSVESAELQATVILNCIVEGSDVGDEWCVGIVVTSNAEYFARRVFCIRLLDASVPEIPKAEEQIHGGGVKVTDERVVVSDCNGSHRIFGA